jgi:hypothetical protein
VWDEEVIGDPEQRGWVGKEGLQGWRQGVWRDGAGRVTVDPLMAI